MQECGPLTTRTATKDEHVTVNCNSNMECSWTWTHLSIGSTTRTLRSIPQLIFCSMNNRQSLKRFPIKDDSPKVDDIVTDLGLSWHRPHSIEKYASRLNSILTDNCETKVDKVQHGAYKHSAYMVGGVLEINPWLHTLESTL